MPSLVNPSINDNFNEDDLAYSMKADRVRLLSFSGKRNEYVDVGSEARITEHVKKN